MRTKNISAVLVVCIALSSVCSFGAELAQISPLKGAVESNLPNEMVNPEIIGVNKEAGHSTLIPYPDIKTALIGTREASPFHKSLNGKWKFNWVSKPDDRPTDFYKANYNISDWAEIDVPGCWQMQGYDVPIYINAGYPFPKNPPYIDTSSIRSAHTEQPLPFLITGKAERSLFILTVR